MLMEDEPEDGRVKQQSSQTLSVFSSTQFAHGMSSSQVESMLSPFRKEAFVPECWDLPAQACCRAVPLQHCW